MIPDSSHWQLFETITSAEIQSLENGTHKFYVRARDAWLNIDPTPPTWTFTVDITPPTVTINSPQREQHIKGRVALIGSAFDNSPLKDFDSYELNYGLSISDNQEPNWQKDRFSQIKSSEVRNDTLGIFDTIGLADSLYRIRLLAVDTLKHSSKDEILVTVDNTAPRVEIIRPVARDTIDQRIDILATVADRHIARYLLEHKMRYHQSWQVLLDQQSERSLENQLLHTWENQSDSGEVTLRLTAWDKAGNTSADSVQFLLNNPNFQRPTATISEPQDNAYVHDWIPITGFVRDESALHYRLALRAPNLDTLLAEGNTPKENEALYVLDTKAFADGKYTLVLTVTNEKQYQRSHSIAMAIDNTPPVAQLAAPSSDTISCSVQLQGEAFDRNLASMTLKYAKLAETDPAKFIVLDTTFALWNTMDLHGAYTLYLFAKDKAGLETTAQRTYYLNNPRYEKSDGVHKKQDEFSLYIPPNGFSASVFCLKKLDQDAFKFDVNVLTPTDLIVEIQTSAEQTAFYKPGILTIDYRSLPLVQLEEDRLKVHVWENQTWKLLGGTLDKEKKIITTAIGRTGIYGLFENKGVVEPSEASKELRLESQPRIFSPQGNGFSNTTALSFDLGKSANVTIKIYNAAGRLVRVLKENESMPSGNNVVYWDGKDEWSNFCAGGLYMITIQAAEKVTTKTVAIVNK